MTTIGNCRICDGKTGRNPWRCDDHYRCDDCRTRDGLCTYTEGVLCDPCHNIRVEKRIAKFAGDTDYTSEIICPWCGYVHSDCFEWDDGENECHDCGRKFDVTRNAEITYSTERCGNGD